VLSSSSLPFPCCLIPIRVSFFLPATQVTHNDLENATASCYSVAHLTARSELISVPLAQPSASLDSSTSALVLPSPVDSLSNPSTPLNSLNPRRAMTSLISQPPNASSTSSSSSDQSAAAKSAPNVPQVTTTLPSTNAPVSSLVSDRPSDEEEEPDVKDRNTEEDDDKKNVADSQPPPQKDEDKESQKPTLYSANYHAAPRGGGSKGTTSKDSKRPSTNNSHPSKASVVPLNAVQVKVKPPISDHTLNRKKKSMQIREQTIRDLSAYFFLFLFLLPPPDLLFFLAAFLFRVVLVIFPTICLGMSLLIFWPWFYYRSAYALPVICCACPLILVGVHRFFYSQFRLRGTKMMNMFKYKEDYTVADPKHKPRDHPLLQVCFPPSPSTFSCRSYSPFLSLFNSRLWITTAQIPLCP
jgi:hypothetical protein